jgi:outer membrane protein TolC
MRIVAAIVLGTALLGAAEGDAGAGPVQAAVARAGFLAAVEAAPAVRVAREVALGATAARRAAGILPDPTVGAEVRRSTAADGLYLMLEQELPRWGERDAGRSRAAAEALMAGADADAVRAAVATAVATQAALARAATARAALADAEAGRIRVLLAALEAAVAAGQARVGDGLVLRSRLQAVELAATDERRQAADADDEARAVLGLSANAALPAADLPDPAELESAGDPALRAAAARMAAATAEGDMARSRGHPVVAVGAGWEDEDLDRADVTWKATLTVSVPLWRDAYAAGQRVAAARGRAAALERDQAAREAETLLRRARRAAAQAVAARGQAEAIATRVAAELDALRQELATGEPTALMRITDRLDAAAAASRDAIAARAEAEGLAARLWRFAIPPGP